MKKLKVFIYLSLFCCLLLWTYKNKRIILGRIERIHKTFLLLTEKNFTVDVLSANSNGSKSSNIADSKTQLVITEVFRYLGHIKNCVTELYSLAKQKLVNIYIFKKFFKFDGVVDYNSTGNESSKSEVTEGYFDNVSAFDSQKDTQEQISNLVNKTNRADYASNKKDILDLNERQIEILNYIRNFDKITMLDISHRFKGVSERTLRRDMDKLELTGFVIQFGKTRNSYYVVVTN